MQLKEISPSSIGIGLIIGVIMTAANVYLGLRVGMTVSASIPAAVLAIGIYKGLLKKGTILEVNIVQTLASAGESLAAGIIFTLPALVILQVWTDFDFWYTSLIAIAGGLLGVCFMVPLRKALIVEEKNLIYPEGVACASVLKAGEIEGTSGLKIILGGLGLGAIYKFVQSGARFILGSLDGATQIAGRLFYFGCDLSPALLSVGYIVRLPIASLIFLGGVLGFCIILPILSVSENLALAENFTEAAMTIWSQKIRYVGVGAMICGGIWSIFSVRQGISKGVSGLMEGLQGRDVKKLSRTERDIGLVPLATILIGCFFLMLWIYNSIIQSFGIALMTTVLMVICSFFFVAVSSYIVGLVGSSNNPVSGMTISALLVTSALFFVLGESGESAIFSTLGVAAIVCCAACTAGDCSQDLKTGQLVGASPRAQQIVQIIGVIIPAFVLAPVLSLLHSSYTLGSPELPAPQAGLFASLTEGIFGDGQLPLSMILTGFLIGAAVILFDLLVLAKRNKFRLHLMPMAVGIYLPLSLSTPIFIGGLIRHFVEKWQSRNRRANEGEDQGVLLSSGLIAGEAIMGIFLALLIYFEISVEPGLPSWWPITIFSILAFLGVCFAFWKTKKVNG